ncbi:hypothetical protein GCM10009676_26460 [Prauserella halophila]|uniref:M23ase beta-sheet core domain-containing protein n=1 Tax=Prauserella halophila TaxID=185641 RepID=A0ABP4GZ53_9PSEU
MRFRSTVRGPAGPPPHARTTRPAPEAPGGRARAVTPAAALTPALTPAVATVVALLMVATPPAPTPAPAPRSATTVAGAGTAVGAAAQPAADVTFAWPLDPQPGVVRPFDAPDSEYGPGHRGVDLAAAAGQPVLAAAGGRVVHAGDLAGRGVVSIEHPDGLRTTYEPLSVQVDEGDRVRAGLPIGTVARGHDDCAAAACLHWGLRRGERYLDPVTVVPLAGALRLKPWPG